MIAVVGVPAAFLAATLDRAPAPGETARLGFVSTGPADRLWRRYDPRLMPTDRPTLVEASEAELDRTLQAALATLPEATGRARVTPGGLELAVSGRLPLPDTPLGRYINLRLTLAPSGEGLDIGRLAIGRVEVPHALIRPAAVAALDWLIAPGRGTEMLKSVRSLDVEGDRVAVVFQPPADLKSDIARAVRRTLDAVPAERVRPYYAVLVGALGGARNGTVSLAAMMKPLFRRAAQRSERADAVLENRAAIVALAMLFGDARFERLTGAVRTEEPAGPQPGALRVHLAGRRDFVQHFTISAAITAVANDGLADAIGLGKEFRDAGGKSGFSFTDIAADRAGVRFARLAISSDAAARRIQRRLAAGLTEADMFPATADLPEHLSEAEFRRRFGDTTSPAYARLAGEIERRIGGLTIHR